MSAIHSIIVSAPFGNYIQPRGATPTLGTFTLYERPGRWRRVVKTVRYHRSLRSWTNQIGLRNPGITWLLAHQDMLPSRIVSIHGFNINEWHAILSRASVLPVHPLAWELNVSCPNVSDDELDYEELFGFARASLGDAVIVKLPPVNYNRMLVSAKRVGVDKFHCCNTLPVPAGGISGQVLKPLALSAVREVRKLAGPTAFIIGGGGVKTEQDVSEYHAAGANNVAIGSALLNPFYASLGIRELIRKVESDG